MLSLDELLALAWPPAPGKGGGDRRGPLGLPWGPCRTSRTLPRPARARFKGPKKLYLDAMECYDMIDFPNFPCHT
jgi:hypothetical protein